MCPSLGDLKKSMNNFSSLFNFDKLKSTLAEAVADPQDIVKRSAWIQDAESVQHHSIQSGAVIYWAFGETGHQGLPHNAITVGTDADGKPLYVGRGYRSNTVQVGKVTSDGRCYVPYVCL
jgi:hypothetical protein